MAIRLEGRSFRQVGGAKVYNCERPSLRRLAFPYCGWINSGRGKPQQSPRFRSRFFHRDETMPSDGVKALAAPDGVFQHKRSISSLTADPETREFGVPDGIACAQPID